MSVTETILPLSISLAQGLLIGLERGWQKREAEDGTRVGGMRTYGLIGFLGGFSGLLALKTHLALVGFAFISVAIGLVVGYSFSARKSGNVGITSLIAGLLTFLFGAAATLGYMVEAGAAAVVTAFLLGSKPELHRWVSTLEPQELRATLKLLVISVVILPILPNRGYGPWEALNLFEIWWMVVLIASISFCGYFAVKMGGPGKGIILTGLIAGLASSTALTLHFSRLAHRQPGSSSILATGVLLACGTMFPRMLVVASIVNWQIFQALLVPVIAMGGVVFTGAALLWWLVERSGPEQDKANLRNPFEIGSALMFGGLLGLIMLAAKGLEVTFGEAGILALAGISGITDVDAITLTLAKMSRSEFAVELAAFGIVFAGAVNSIVKGFLSILIGGKAFGVRASIPLIVASAVGIALAWSAVDLPGSGFSNP